MSSKISKALAAALAVCLTFSACGKSENSSDAASSDGSKKPVERQIVDPSEITCADSYRFDKLKFDGIEQQECSILIEAETAEENSGVTVKSDRFLK